MARALTLLTLVALTLAGCGGPVDGHNSIEPVMVPSPEALRIPMTRDAVMVNTGAAAGAASVGNGLVQHVAYSHSLGMRLPVAAIEPTLESHVSRCRTAGPTVCIVVSSSLYAFAEDQTSASLQIRAIPSWIEQFLAGAEAEAEAARGAITSRQTTAEDLTLSIIDTDARLAAQTGLRARIEQLLADRPGKLGELLEIERELARINGEIDALTASLQALRQRVSMSQLSVGYETRRDPISAGVLAPLADAFSGFLYNLSRAVAAVITAFAIGLPWLLLIGLLLWIWLRLIWPRLRHRKDRP